MTKLLDQAVFRLRSLPETTQDAAAELLLQFVEQPSGSLLTDAQVREVHIALHEVEKECFATDEEVADLWRRFDR